jgi:signal transduction histidine kinase
VCIGEDITERTRAVEELRRSREALRALARHLHGAREEEDTRLSREIHDQLGQALTALRLDLSWLGRKLLGADAAVRNKIAAMVALADDTIEAGRRIAADLRPPILDDLGLVAALEWFVAHFAGRAGLRHRLLMRRQELAVDRDLAIVAYRIVQEALTNVARHAQAREVEVRLDQTDGMLLLEIRDDGRGISEEAVRDPASLGLAGMRERALTRGGAVEVGPARGGGTLVRATIPMERRREPRERA